MGIKQYKPTSPGRRGATGQTFEEITKRKPEKALVVPLKKKAGRNAQGRITVRHRGGGAKRQLRIIDFKRNNFGVPGKVAAIEYDPNRSARIALIHFVDGDKRYILWPVGLKVGDTVMSGPDAEARDGNCIPIENIPTGTTIHAIELEPGKGAQMVRSAGGAAQLIAKEGQYAQVRLPSGHIRIVHVRCRATVGQVGNVEHENRKIGGAGHMRRMGRRPAVRGVVMSPRDHPHGGGEAKSPVGGQAQTPWGKPAMGLRTRNNPRTDRFVIRPQKRKKK